MFDPWISVIEPHHSTGRLKKLYDQSQNPDGSVDRVLKIHSLRPRTLHAHLVLYKAVLHTKPSDLSYRERELVGTYSSLINGCNYCVEHHKAGLGRHLQNMNLADELLDNAAGNIDTGVLTDREKAMILYSKKLSKKPELMTKEDISPLRSAGLTDEGILDLNQIVAYFAYVNRMVLGLGVDLGDEKLGFHPSEDSTGFSHS